MRTDSVNLSQQAIGAIASVVKAKFGERYHQAQQYSTKSKNAQEAHEAIRPTHVEVGQAGHSPQEQRLYKLIWARAVASQMAPAQMLKTKIIAQARDKSIPEFHAHGSVIVFDGWLKADPPARNASRSEAGGGARGEENVLPKIDSGEALTLLEIAATGKETQPPNRYSEAGLVKELEKRGIGRPSTYAPTIKTIMDRGYVEKEQRSLKPTETGEVVSDFLDKYFAQYISDDFTREMEDKLDLIAEGKEDYVKMLTDFYGPFTKEVKSKNKVEKITNLGDAPAEIKCPVCGGPMIIKLGKSGKFYSCAKFPDCTGARTMEGKELEGPKPTGEKCPECGGDLIEREGRYGKFVACANYPKCKYIKKR
jgi:DNA topoisomerase-1